MPATVVTRLRDPAPLDEFFTDAVAAIEQAMTSEGNLGADALADADNAWWSVTAWQDRGLMQACVDSEPHLGISTRLDHFCDEATFVDWEQASPALPDWQTSWRHLTADGKAADLTYPSPANQTRDFPPPVVPPPASPEAASTKPGNGRPRPPAAGVACCLAADEPMITARQVARAAPAGSAGPGRWAGTPRSLAGRASIEGETHEFAKPRSGCRAGSRRLRRRLILVGGDPPPCRARDWPSPPSRTR
jgi:hypothetical protein